MSFPAGLITASTARSNRQMCAASGLGQEAITYTPNSPYLRVSFGQRTFDAEGVEAPGRFFSRQIHYPGGSSSGVTIGRGYDMGRRTALQVERELKVAGVSDLDAKTLATGAGLRGAKAYDFVATNHERAPILTLEAQNALFERVVAPEMISDISRILTKGDVVEKYGRVEWGALKPEVKELVFDLRYRGDYSPSSRALLQRHIVENNTAALLVAMEQREYWRSAGVPEGRINARIEMLRFAGKG
jgi:hypothetical protein